MDAACLITHHAESPTATEQHSTDIGIGITTAQPSPTTHQAHDTMADLKSCPPLTRASVVAAHDLVRPHVHRTPVLTNSTLSRLASTPAGDRPGDLEAGVGHDGAQAEAEGKGEKKARPVIRLWFKCENLQRVGAFKVRGAFHAVERLKADGGWVAGGGMARGVVTHSSGEFVSFLFLPPPLPPFFFCVLCSSPG